MAVVKCLWMMWLWIFSSFSDSTPNQSRAEWIGAPSAGVKRLLTALWCRWRWVWGREWALGSAPGFLKVLPRCWAGVLSSSGGRRPAATQIDSGPVCMCGSTRGLVAGGGRATMDCENPPHVAWTPVCWPSSGGSSCSSSSRPSSRCCPSRGRSSSRRRLSGVGGRQLLAGCGHLARPLALCSGHEVVVVAVATAEPELHTLGGDDVIVVAWCPAAAGAGGTRQGADGALNCSKETKQAKLPTCRFHSLQKAKLDLQY